MWTTPRMPAAGNGAFSLEIKRGGEVLMVGSGGVEVGEMDMKLPPPAEAVLWG